MCPKGVVWPHDPGDDPCGEDARALPAGVLFPGREEDPCGEDGSSAAPSSWEEDREEDPCWNGLRPNPPTSELEGAAGGEALGDESSCGRRKWGGGDRTRVARAVDLLSGDSSNCIKDESCSPSPEDAATPVPPLGSSSFARGDDDVVAAREGGAPNTKPASAASNSLRSARPGAGAAEWAPCALRAGRWALLRAEEDRAPCAVSSIVKPRD